MKKIFARNSPNKYEYVIILLLATGIIITLYSYLFLASVVILIFFLIVLSVRRVSINMEPKSLRIDFKVWFIVYKRISKSFHNVSTNITAIEFYDDHKMALSLDAGLAPEESEVRSISLWSPQESLELGN